MQIQETNLAGCFVIESSVYRDSRGFFKETYHRKKFEDALGFRVDFVQDNQSVSHKHVLRGLHFQKGQYTQAKLGRVVRGRVLDVVVDLRKGSPTFGDSFCIELSDNNHLQIFIPKGLAHGFLALEDQTIFSYKCDAHYHKESEMGIRFNDPDLGIDWKVNESDLILSEKDLALPLFKELFP